jgi:flagellar FliL protein
MADEGFIDKRVESKRTQKSDFPIIFIIIILAVVMGTGGFFAGKIFSSRDIIINKNPKNQTTAAAGQKKSSQNKIPQGTGEDTSLKNQTRIQGNEITGFSRTGSTGSDNDETKIKPGIIMLETFTVNLNDPFGRRYAEVSVNLVINDKILVKDITENELLIPQIRDEIFMIISGKSYADLKSTAGKVTLKEEIMIRINEILKAELKREPITQVLFTKFLIQ